MKIAFLGNHSVDFTSESHHCKSLEALGHTVIRLQETKASSSVILAAAKQCQLFVWVHTHGWRTPVVNGITMRYVLAELKRRGIPTMSYHLDVWFGLKRQDDMKTDEVWEIEHFFTVDKLMAEYFNNPTTSNGRTTGHYLQAGVFHAECYMAEPLKEGEVL